MHVEVMFYSLYRPKPLSLYPESPLILSDPVIVLDCMVYRPSVNVNGKRILLTAILQ